MEINKTDNKYIYVIVGKNIRRIRKEHKLTQAKLAELINYDVGIIDFEGFDDIDDIISKRLKVPITEFFKDM